MHPLRLISQEIESSGCSLCSNLVPARTRIVVSKGNPEADVVIVGQNPGAVEDSLGEPFVGPAGKLLDQIITGAGYSPRSDFWFTNVVMCKSYGNERPSTEEINNCSENFSRIAGTHKKLLVLGSAALEGVLRSYGQHHLGKLGLPMSKLLTRGNPINLIGNRVLFVTYHPAYLLRNGATNEDFSDYKTVMQEIISAKLWTRNQVSDVENTSALQNMTMNTLF